MCRCVDSGTMSPPAPAPDRRWLVCYFPAAWLGHVCQGLATGVLGPSQVSSIIIMVSLSPVYLLSTQPYLGLALARPVSGPQTSLVWTVRAVGSCLATVVTGAVFRWGMIGLDMETWHHHTWCPGPECGPSTPRWSSSRPRCCWWDSPWLCSPGHPPSHCCSLVA